MAEAKSDFWEISLSNGARCSQRLLFLKNVRGAGGERNERARKDPEERKISEM